MEAVEIIDVLATLWGVFTAVFGEDTTIGARAISVIAILVTLTGSASYLVKFLEAIADVTPSTKDDLYVSTFKRWLGYVSAFLDRIAANPDQTKARKPKQ